jgi:glycosyltransferase involved in cell wall biosynthesis
MFSLHVDTARTWRGGQNQVLLTVLGLRERGHRAALVAHPEGELRRRASEGTDLFPLAPRTEMDLRAGWQLSRLLRNFEPDVVHVHDAHGVAIAALALSLAGSRPRPRFVASRRVDFHIRKNAFSRWKYRQVDCFICASAFIESMLIDDGVPATSTTVVYEGIDQDQIAAVPALDVHQVFGLPPDAPVVGNVAALVPHKGQRYLVDAARLVANEVPEVRFLIAGEGELEQSLTQQIVRLGLTQHVILTGFRPDVLALHKAFDVFVMSSVTEGLGTSALDAMAAGRPVVATRAGGLSEVVDDGETGLLVPIRDAPALATAITRLLKDEAWRGQCGRTALERVRRRFTAARMVDETVAVYARLADKRPEADTAGPAGAD